MKALILSFLMLSTLFLISCEKEVKEQTCELNDCAFCEDRSFEKENDDKRVWMQNMPDELKGKKVEKYILSPIVKEGDCGYIISGKVKYVITPPQVQTYSPPLPSMEPLTIIIDYGDGELDAWAVKTVYGKKKRKGKKGKGMEKCGSYDEDEKRGHQEGMKCCKFEQKCMQNEDQVDVVTTALDRTATAVNTK